MLRRVGSSPTTRTFPAPLGRVFSEDPIISIAMDQIERIQVMEALLDQASAAVQGLGEALDAYESAQTALRSLGEYLASEEWIADYEADEAGQLPADLKRGVLSQDAVYDLLAEDQNQAARMLDIVASRLRQG